MNRFKREIKRRKLAKKKRKAYTMYGVYTRDADKATQRLREKEVK